MRVNTLAVLAIVRAAIAEDKRTADGSHFTPDGLRAFAAQNRPENIDAAWRLYASIIIAKQEK